MTDAPDRLRILLVEDNESVRDLTEAMLEEVGARVVSVADAEAALATIDGQPFDALLTDLNLPGMSGVALAREAAKRYPKLPIIVASGYAKATVEELRRELPDTLFVLAKPYDLDALEKILGTVVPRGTA